MADTRDISYPLRGFLVPESRIGESTFSESDSSYSEQGALPGIGKTDDASSGYVIRSSGGIYDDMIVKVAQPGNAALGAARVLYKFDGQSDDNYRGVLGVNTFSGAETIHYTHTGGAAPTAINATTLKKQQDVFVTYEESGIVYLKRVDTNSRTVQSVTIPWNTNRAATAVVELPQSGRVLLYGFDSSYDGMWDAIYTDDYVTWDTYSNLCFLIPKTSTIDSVAAFADEDNNVVILIAYTFSGSAWLAQFASSDAGGTFSEIYHDNYTHGLPTFGCDGKGRPFMFYMDGSDFTFVNSSSFFDPVNDSINAQAIDTVTITASAAVTDHEGTITVFAQVDSTAQVTCYQKDLSDSGFQQLTHDALLIDKNLAGTVSDFETLSAAYAAGYAFIFGVPSSPAAGVNGIQLVRFGGWTNAGPGHANQYTTKVKRVERDRFGYGDNHTGLGLSGWGWLANDNPSATGWAAAGAGTGALSTTEFAIDVTTAANALAFQRIAALLDQRMIHFELKVDSGGSRATPQIGAIVGTTGDGRIHFCADTTGFSIVDVVGAATVGAVNIDMTKWVEIMIVAGVDWYANTNNPVEWNVLYRFAGATTWSAIRFQITTGATVDALEWGHPAAGTGVSHWRYFMVGEFQTADPTAPFLSSLSAGTDSRSSVMVGGCVTSNPYPLSDFYDNKVDAQFFTAYGGPARRDEIHNIDLNYQYPRQAIDHQISPSPYRLWRSNDTTEQIFAWDLDNDTDLGSRSVCLYIANANFYTAELEAWDGATWASIGTWDTTVGTGLTFFLNGDMLRPNISTTSNIGRYLHEGALDRGTVKLAAGKYRRIVNQRSGAWGQLGGKRAGLRIELQGTEPANGTCDIYAPTACLVVHGVTTHYDKFRVRIPAQTTADGFFQAGLIMVGGLFVAGQQWSWGYSREFQQNAEISTDRWGTTRARRAGPVKQIVSVAWSDGVCMTDLHAEDPEPDYLAPKATGEGIANKADVPFLLSGMLEHLSSGETPVVLLPSVPDASVSDEVMITDPLLMTYGRIISSVSVENVQGDELEDEVYRVQNVTIEEIV
jgi:hypothetical protein